MKNDVKKRLSDEVGCALPPISREILSQPISIGAPPARRRKTVELLTAIMAIAAALSLVVAGLVESRKSRVTCVLLDITPDVQVVVKNGEVISVDALDGDAKAIVDAVGGFEFSRNPSEVIIKIVAVAYEMGLISSEESLEIGAINNDSAAARAILESILQDLSSLDEFPLKVETKTIDFDEYNERAFNDSGARVDDLDGDLDLVLRADEI